MTNEKLIAYARSLKGDVFKVRFSGNVVTFGTKKSAQRAYRISGAFSKGLRKPPAPLEIEGVGTCWQISYRPIACEGWCTIVLDNPIRLDVEVITIRVEDVMEVVE